MKKMTSRIERIVIDCRNLKGNSYPKTSYTVVTFFVSGL